VIEPDTNNIDTATYATGVIMLVLSLFTTGVMIYRLNGAIGAMLVTFAMVIVSCAASYTVAQL